jgi:hypothetical protein
MARGSVLYVKEIMSTRALPVACVAIMALLTAAVIRLRYTLPPPPASAQHVKPWTLQSASEGMIFTWNRSAAELRKATSVNLILHNGRTPTTHPLDRRTGTLIIPYYPQAAVMSVDGIRTLLYGSEPRTPAPPKLESERKKDLYKGPHEHRLELTMLLSNRGRKVVSTAAVTLPRVPTYVQRPIDVELSIKVTPQGRVTNVASHYPDDPLRNRLSAVAADAVSKWQFDRITVTSYREGRIRVLFTPQGMSVRPVSVG